MQHVGIFPAMLFAVNSKPDSGSFTSFIMKFIFLKQDFRSHGRPVEGFLAYRYSPVSGVVTFIFTKISR